MPPKKIEAAFLADAADPTETGPAAQRRTVVAHHRPQLPMLLTGWHTCEDLQILLASTLYPIRDGPQRIRDEGVGTTPSSGTAA